MTTFAGTVTAGNRCARTPSRASTVEVDDVSGPHTIVALGEDCAVCSDPLEPGQVYFFLLEAGVVHDHCTA